MKEKSVTLKEVYERVIVLESKFDELGYRNKKTSRFFTFWVFVLVLIELLNFAFNYLLYSLYKG